MAKINGFSHRQLPSNPDVEWCPAVIFVDTKETIRNETIRSETVKLTIFETPKFTPNNTRVAGAIGPVACRLCAKSCTDAYHTLLEEDIDQVSTVVKAAETPVNFRLLSDARRELSPGELRIQRDLTQLEAAGKLLVLNGEPFLITQQ